jgi:hypothetical protein
MNGKVNGEAIPERIDRRRTVVDELGQFLPVGLPFSIVGVASGNFIPPG